MAAAEFIENPSRPVRQALRIRPYRRRTNGEVIVDKLNDLGTIVIFLVLPWCLLNYPLVSRTVAYLHPHPLRVNADGTRFCGKFRRWHLWSVTGKVLGSQTVTSHAAGYTHDAYTGQSSTWVSTNIRDNVRVQLSDGSQRDLHLVNFNISAQPEDVISVWYAKRGSKWVTAAVLNHTTRQQSISLKHTDLGTILLPASGLLVGLIVVNSMLSVFVCALSPLFLLLMALFLVGSKRARNTFAKRDIAALWELSADDAQRLMRPPGGYPPARIRR